MNKRSKEGDRPVKPEALKADLMSPEDARKPCEAEDTALVVPNLAARRTRLGDPGSVSYHAAVGKESIAAEEDKSGSSRRSRDL